MTSISRMLGIVIIIIGIYAIFTNKYPGKNESYERLKKKYGEVSQKRVALFDGIFCIIFGLIYIFTEGMTILIIMFVLYFPLKILFAKFKFLTDIK
jgi:uncharacterized membrane protein HdeD (DUF308 family)